MSGPVGPFERLRAADPARRLPAVDPDSPSARAIEGVVLAPAGEASPDRRRRRLWVMIMVGGLVIAAAAFVWLRPVTEPLTVGCYRAADIDADRVVVTSSSRSDAVEACTPLWEPGGEFGSDRQGPAPVLVACVLGSGALGVFPSPDRGDVCTDLGLAHPELSPEEANRRIVEVQEALVDRFLDACLPEAEARRLVEEELSGRGLEGWRVVVSQPFTDDRACASLAFDVPSRTVELVPVSP